MMMSVRVRPGVQNLNRDSLLPARWRVHVQSNITLAKF